MYVGHKFKGGWLGWIRNSEKNMVNFIIMVERGRLVEKYAKNLKLKAN